MSEQESYVPQFDHEDFQKGDILAICMNGNGRSKQIAKALEERGYGEVHTLGVGHLSGLSFDEKLAALQKARVLVCAANDVEGMVKDLLKQARVLRREMGDKTVINVAIPEVVHAMTHYTRTKDDKEKAREIIHGLLEKVGFKYKQESEGPSEQ